MALTHLQRLEAEAIHVLREAAAEAERPVMLYSAGKDSSVLLHLARKAFAPSTPPFPLLHVDTTWKFRDMYALRDRAAAAAGMELIVHRNPDAIERGINPIEHGSAVHTRIWKTDGLKQALDAGGFDVAIGGARRDEERVRAKERIFSFRARGHGWKPKRQRPELWRLYNARKGEGEGFRVFPLSNWTEIDVWTYIAAERIEVSSLYFAAPRPTVERDGTILALDDERMTLRPDEIARERWIRFRTLGCYPLSGAVESRATTVTEIIAEIGSDGAPERQGRLIDRDSRASMERKKKEGYF
jgi:sulfate adenylyltransferase subunit 2